jgi:3-methylfumaryl-CoA hydratase
LPDLRSNPACSAPDLIRLTEWRGSPEHWSDELTPTSLRGLAALLDDTASPCPGDALVPGGHWLYFLPRAAQSELGIDGHPLGGSFLPPVPLPRRMWAGGRMVFHAQLRVGEAVTRRSEVQKVQTKNGRSGPIVFVTVRHEVAGPAGLAIVEEQDLGYREMPAPGQAAAPGESAPAVATWRRKVRPDATLLFRYSALTFNAHRIHYDRTYAHEVEGYPGLVVHGPYKLRCCSL